MSDLFDNFEKFRTNQELISIYEFPLYTDNPWITGAIDSKPISLLNPVIHNNKGVFLPRIILRYFCYINGDAVIDYASKPAESKIKSYEPAPNELSYLINLCLGIRTEVGTCMRKFKPALTDNSNYGFISNSQYYPNYEKEVLLSGSPLIPSLFRTVNLSIENYFNKLISMKEKELSNAVRAAKLYSNALFLAERAPKISWIMLVSAIEAAAESQRYKIDNLDLIKNEFPELYDLIDSSNKSHEIFKELNNVINLKAQKKFIQFIKKYYPIPQKRTDLPEGFLIDWDNFDKALKKIYEYRSNALHSVGTGAFPQEMCYPPFKIQDGEQVEIEREWVGEIFYGRGRVRLNQEDIPMNLAKFEEIVRLSLLKWIDDTK
ncbi:TPA: hypothetical protein ACXYKD_003714 [Legionella anisa]